MVHIEAPYQCLCCFEKKLFFEYGLFSASGVGSII